MVRHRSVTEGVNGQAIGSLGALGNPAVWLLVRSQRADRQSASELADSVWPVIGGGQSRTKGDAMTVLSFLAGTAEARCASGNDEIRRDQFEGFSSIEATKQ